VGTKGYMAPEILKNKFYTGEAIDMFSMGVIFFVMRNGSPPF